MSRGTALLALCLAAAPARAQTPDPGAGIGIQDGQGNFYSVSNRHSQWAFFNVTKLTLTGGVLWNVPFTTNADVSATVITVDREGNLIVGGTIYENRSRDIIVVKYTPYGAFMWEKIYQSAGNAVPTIATTDADGNILIAATEAEPGGSHVRMIRYGTMGAYFWASQYRGGRTNYARSIFIDPNGDARVTVEVGSNWQGGSPQVRQVLFTTYGAVVPQ